MLRVLKALTLILSVAALFLFTGCGATNSQARFVNAISDDTQQLDIDFNGTKTFTGVGPFPSDSGSTYENIPSGSDKIAGYVTGTTTNPVFSETSPVTFASGSGYTVVATGFLTGTITFLAPTDNNTEPADGMVNFRVIDASPSGPAAVDVYIIANPVTCSLGATGCTATFSNLTSPSAPSTAVSTYYTTTYNSNGEGYTLFVATHGNTNPLFSYTPIMVGSLTQGSIRTIVLVDGGAGISSSPLILSDLN
jgi:hypothetical protein